MPVRWQGLGAGGGDMPCRSFVFEKYQVSFLRVLISGIRAGIHQASDPLPSSRIFEELQDRICRDRNGPEGL